MGNRRTECGTCGEKGWEFNEQDGIAFHVHLVHFLLTFGIFRTNCFCFYYCYQFEGLNEMEDLCHFHINSFSSSFQKFSIQSGAFFNIPISRNTTLFLVTILRQTYKTKKEFSRWKRIYSVPTFLMVKKIERSKIRFY